MKIHTDYTTIDSLFSDWKDRLGSDYLPYRNHVYRVFNLASALAKANHEDIEKIAIASAFHDVSIWLDATFDYLDPSAQRAESYLLNIGNESWMRTVNLMIGQHHKVTPWRGRGAESLLVEAFRCADWLDIMFFMLPTRLPKSFLCEVERTFPREGFNGRVTALTLRWALRHPFNPLPMFRW
jgi:hypothetical protein